MAPSLLASTLTPTPTSSPTPSLALPCPNSGPRPSPAPGLAPSSSPSLGPRHRDVLARCGPSPSPHSLSTPTLARRGARARAGVTPTLKHRCRSCAAATCYKAAHDREATAGRGGGGGTRMASIAPTIVCLSWCCRSAGGAKTSWCGEVTLQSIKQRRYTSQFATDCATTCSLTGGDTWAAEASPRPRPCIAYSARTSSGLNLVNERHGA